MQLFAPRPRRELLALAALLVTVSWKSRFLSRTVRYNRDPQQDGAEAERLYRQAARLQKAMGQSALVATIALATRWVLFEQLEDVLGLLAEALQREPRADLSWSNIKVRPDKWPNRGRSRSSDVHTMHNRSDPWTSPS